MRRPTTGPKKMVFVCMHVSPVLENAWNCRIAKKVGKQEDVEALGKQVDVQALGKQVDVQTVLVSM